MGDIILSDQARTALLSALDLKAPVLAVEMPPALVQRLDIPSTSVVSRDDWRIWMNRVANAGTILLWPCGRRSDDQEFLQTLGISIGDKTRIWSFHPMSLFGVEHLTGDTVQALLRTVGIGDGVCANTRIGYFARSFRRDPSIEQQLTLEELNALLDRLTPVVPQPEPVKPRISTKVLLQAAEAGVSPPPPEEPKVQKRKVQKPKADVRKAKAPTSPKATAPAPRKAAKTQRKPAVKPAPSAKKTVKKVAKKTSKKIVKKVAKKASKRSAKKSPVKPAPRVAKKMAKKTAKRAVKKTTKSAVKKSAKKVAKRITKKAARQTKAKAKRR